MGGVVPPLSPLGREGWNGLVKKADRIDKNTPSHPRGDRGGATPSTPMAGGVDDVFIAVLSVFRLFRKIRSTPSHPRGERGGSTPSTPGVGGVVPPLSPLGWDGWENFGLGNILLGAGRKKNQHSPNHSTTKVQPPSCGCILPLWRTHRRHRPPV